MRVDEIEELQYITPITNLPSILTRGILSHALASHLSHESIAMEEVQDRRANVKVPRGRPLHEYANLYFNARNPMMYLRQNRHRTLSVVRVNPGVLKLPDVVITDRNASRSWCRWEPSPEGLDMIDAERVFAERWTHPDDQYEQYQHKGEMCAEVLVPDLVPPDFIMGAYVSCASSAAQARAFVPSLPITVNGYVFFFTARR